MASLNTIKSWFKTGLIPTGAQFSAAWDSYFHKDDTIPASKIENLDNRFGDKIDKEIFQYHEESPEAHIELFTGVQAAFTGVEEKFAGVHDEFAVVRSEFSNATSIGFKGLAEAATVPVVPVAETPVFYQATAGVTYANFKDAAAVAISIPLKVGDKYVVNPRLVSVGDKWSGVWESVDGLDGAEFQKKADAESQMSELERKVVSKEELLVIGKNKIDKAKIQVGYLQSNGGVASVGNGIRVENIPDLDFTKKYVMTGQRNNSSASVRGLIRNASGAVIKVIMANGTSEQTIDLADGTGGLAACLDLNISDDFNVPSVGSTPTNNSYANAVMLRLEGSPGMYEAYTEGIPVAKVIGVATQAALDTTNTDVALLGDKVSESILKNELFIIGKNKADKSKITTGIYSSNGILQSSPIGIHIEDVKNIDFSKKYWMSGQRANSAMFTRAITRNSLGGIVQVIMANGTSEQLLDLAAGDITNGLPVRLDINVADDYRFPTTGSTPTSNGYANSLMLRLEGDTNTYEAYTEGIPINTIIGAVKDEDLLPVKIAADKAEAFTDSISKDYDMSYNFSGASSYALPKTYLLNNPGDYIEFVAKWNSSDYNFGLGLIGLKSNNASNLFGYYSAGVMYLRERKLAPTDPNPAYIIFDSLPSLVRFNKIKLLVNSTGSYELYFDDVLKGTKGLINGLEINILGDAYSLTLAKFNIKSLKIYTSETDSNQAEAINIVDFNSGENVKTTYESKVKAIGELSPVYVSFDPVGYKGRERVTFFVRRGNSNQYVGHNVLHEYDMSEIVYSDQYRLVTADEYLFTDGIMTLQSLNTIMGGESECVFQVLNENKVDFTGGVHGDEKFIQFDLFINGVKKDLSEPFTLIPCTKAHYTQISTMHDTAINIGGASSPIDGHPIVAIHYKKTVFSGTGYISYNNLQWKKVMTVFWYHAICCLGRIQGSWFYNENFEKFQSLGDSLFYYQGGEKGDRTIEYFNPSNELSATVTSTLLDSIANDKECDLFVWGRANDSKYYRQTPTYTTILEKKEKSMMQVIYN